MAPPGRIWLSAQRRQFAENALHTVESVMTLAQHRDETQLVKEAAHRILEVDPTEEAAYRILMQVYAAEGQLRLVRELFEQCKKQLWSDLQVKPDKKTLDIVKKIFNGYQQFPGGSEPVTFSHAADDPVASGTTSLPRLALLPPKGFGNGDDGSLIAATLLEDVAIGLCALKSISLVAPHTAAKVAEEPNRQDMFLRYAVSYALDTRLSRRDDESYLFVQLVFVGDDEVVWAERYPIGAVHLSTTYGELSRRIVASIASHIEHRAFAREQFERHPAAYHHYLLGKQHLHHLGLPQIRRARKAFRAALNENPFFAGALSGLARTSHMEWLLTARGDKDLLEAAEKHACQAIEIGQDLASGYRELGVAKLFLGAFDESIDAFERAEAASPHYADVKADYADTLIHAAEAELGLAKVKQAIELNPISPDVYLWTAGGAAYNLRRYEEALGYIAKMADPLPAARLAAACWAMLGDEKRARSLTRKAKDVHPDFDVENWLSIVPSRGDWQEHYREGLRRAGF
ncbi:DNA-binding protein [Rhizobium sp. TRM95111]|uniref:BTAD domain-containing putative transcriptional regulator n=1 Tax=Rhizobium alarense TaxID=2846851 RepID=UPI001F3AB4B7|nr:BTAD domain-containing putative transcriptional regulator [Rhizobium alarense]MCF3640590.1 DNA-binding protein [Rhizobium alarense]